MAIKVYKEGYNIVVDATAHTPPAREKVYLPATWASFGFDDPNEQTCWIKDIADTEEYIFSDLVGVMTDSAGTLVGDKDAVESYLLAIVGDSSNNPSPVI